MKRLAVRTGMLALVSTILGGAILQALLPVFHQRVVNWFVWAISLGAAALVAGLFMGLVMHLGLVLRMRRIVAFLDERMVRYNLRRLPDMGRDELGRVGDAINRLFANMTSLQVDMIDQGRVLRATQEELVLKKALAAKTGELQQRLTERAILFDVLHVATEATDLDAALRDVCERLGPALGHRELAILLAQPAGDGERFVVRAAWGFEDPMAVLGRSLSKGEGIAGQVADAGHPIIVPDVALEPEYMAFWEAVPRSGSFIVVPIMRRRVLIGLMAFTRSAPTRPSDVHIRFLTALADQIGLVIRQASMVDELRSLSTHDELTGLANRRLLRTRLDQEFERCRRFDFSFSLLCLDIDHFKQLNDRCGHPVGDQALRGLAALLQGAVRKVDTSARVGGEEFVILLPQTDLREALKVGEKIRHQVETTPIPGGEGQPGGRLTLSVGVAERRPGEDAASLLSRGDEALYFAKSGGRNCVAVHDGATLAIYRPTEDS